jgi:hypothetical protein
MMNMRRIATTALLILALSLPLPAASEPNQGIIVDGADSIRDTGMTDPGAAPPVPPRMVFESANSSDMHYLMLMPEDLLRLLEEVTPRIIVEYANSIWHDGLVQVPPELEALLEAVKPRLIIAYANSTRAFELGYPCSILDDGAPPVISDVHPTDITGSAATIAWNTNEPATSSVFYGLAPDTYIETVVDSGYVGDHTVTLTGLSQDTTYYYKVGSDDRCGGQAESGEYSFTTLKPLYLPVILRGH